MRHLDFTTLSIKNLKNHKELYDEKRLVADKSIMDAHDHERDHEDQDTCELDSSEDSSISSDEFENEMQYPTFCYH